MYRQVTLPTRTLKSIPRLSSWNRKDRRILRIDVEGVELDDIHSAGLQQAAPKALLIEDNSNGADTTVRDYIEPFLSIVVAKSVRRELLLCEGLDCITTPDPGSWSGIV